MASPVLRTRDVADRPEALLAGHIEGLALAGEPALERLLAPALFAGSPGEAAVAASACLATPGGFAQVCRALAETQGEHRRALARALALSRYADAHRDLLPLLEVEEPALAAAALDALALRGVDPGPALLPLLSSRDPALAAPALRAARASAQPVRSSVERALQDHDPLVRDAALETGLRLGLRSAFLACRDLVDAADPDAGFALAALAILGDEVDAARIETALNCEPLRAAAVTALGYAGRPSAVDSLLATMHDPKLAGIAGEAFSAITGIAIAGELAASAPEESEDLHPAPDSDLDPDPNPETNPDAVASRWRSERARFDPTLRFLCGVPFTLRALVDRFVAAPMRRRRLLALELAVRSRGGYCIETTDWAFEQLRAERRQSFAERPKTASLRRSAR